MCEYVGGNRISRCGSLRALCSSLELCSFGTCDGR